MEEIGIAEAIRTEQAVFSEGDATNDQGKRGGGVSSYSDERICGPQ